MVRGVEICLRVTTHCCAVSACRIQRRISPGTHFLCRYLKASAMYRHSPSCCFQMGTVRIKRALLERERLYNMIMLSKYGLTRKRMEVSDSGHERDYVHNGLSTTPQLRSRSNWPTSILCSLRCCWAVLHTQQMKLLCGHAHDTGDRGAQGWLP